MFLVIGYRLRPLGFVKGGGEVNYLVDVALAVVANVISYYVCKWLDSKDKRHD